MVIKKKGPSGNAKNYITRTKAVRKLQISLPDFRRLCIFKGIYPREPRNKKKASKGATSATTFYYTKDIQYLLHEPLIAKFREHKALGKKIGRALGRGEVGDAARLEKTLTPKIALDHIIKERYPTFVDALRDLDDALSMLFLFSILPTGKYVSARITELCKRLCLEFEHYLIVSHSLRKSFLSIKGIYYQATIQGQDILWLVPYKFVQNVGGDIDFRIMSTFIEFYTTLLGFVNFRLYTSIGLVYPPKFNATSDEKGAELGAFTLEGKAVTTAAINGGRADGDSAMANTETSAAAQAEADKLGDEQIAASEEQDAMDRTAQPEEDVGAIDKFEATAEDADILDQPAAGSSEAASLFAPFTFFLARETPRQPLEFLLKAFGAKRVGWEETMGDGAYVTDETDTSITHHIVDKPQVSHDTNAMEETGDEPRKLLWPHATVPGRTYVQPQWVWDCINQGRLLPSSEYSPGASLPPHLSPWVKPKKGAYDPTLSLAEQEPLGEADEHMQDIDEPAKSAKSQNKLTAAPSNDEKDSEDGGMDVASDDDEEDEDEEDDFGGFSETEDAPIDAEIDEIATSEDEEGDTSTQHQRELLAESLGRPAPAPKAKNPANEARKKNVKRKMEEEEERQRQMMMMSRKKKKLAERMQFGNAKRDEEAEKLRGKRRRIEREKGKA